MKQEIKLTLKESLVFSFIRNRRVEQPISSPEIEPHVSMAGSQIRKVVNGLRKKGLPINANAQGYYMAETPSELSGYVNSFDSRIKEQQEACAGLAGITDVNEWIKLVKYHESFDVVVIDENIQANLFDEFDDNLKYS